MAVRASRELLVLLLVATGTSAAGTCDCEAACSRLVASQLQEIARLRAEVHRLRGASLVQVDPEVYCEVREAAESGAAVAAPARREAATVHSVACDNNWNLHSDQDVQDLARLGCGIVGALAIEGDVTSLTGLENITMSRKHVIVRKSSLSSLLGLEGLQTAGELWIYENDELQSLDGLGSLVSVEGVANIHTNPRLSSLSGLQALQSAGKLQVFRNSGLESLAGTESLVAVDDTLNINNNPSLSSLSGLRSLRTAGTLWVFQNAELRSLAGLENLTTVEEVLNVRLNPVLSSLLGLGGLQTAGRLQIYQSTGLLSLAGLEGVTAVKDTLNINNNPSLSSLSGLDSLQTVGNLFIYQNSNLQSLAGLGSLTSVEEVFNIYSNAKLSSLSGLQSLQIVKQLQIYQNAELQSLAGPENLVIVRGALRIHENPRLVSLSGFGSLQTTGELWLYDNTALLSPSGLEVLATVEEVLNIHSNPMLTSLLGLQSLHTAGRLQIYQNSGLQSLVGLENLTTVRGSLNVNNNPSITSLTGLQHLQTAGELWIFENLGLESPAGLDSLSSVEDGVSIYDNPRLSSLSGLQSLQTAGELMIHRSEGLHSLTGLENLTVVRQQLQISHDYSLTSLAGLESLMTVGALLLSFNTKLTSLAGLESLAYAWGGVVIRGCPSLRSLRGLSSLYRTPQLSVQDTGPLAVLGGPFATGARADKVEFDEGSWPLCITPHERAALVSAVGSMAFSSVPDATWERWRNNSCGWGELFTCTKGRSCNFVFDGRTGRDIPESVFISDPDEGCGVCSGHRLQSQVTMGGVVDFGYALAGDEGGHRSICNCSEVVGPVAELALRGPRLSRQPTIAVCRRGHSCTLELDGEALEPTDQLVLTSSCEGTSLTRGFAASWTAENVYLLRDPATWYTAAPTRYQVCWRAPCTSTADGPTCPVPEENLYFKVGDVELLGAYAQNYRVTLGQELTVANIGFGVLDGDRMRLRRTCGIANKDGLDVLDVSSSGMLFDFGMLTPERVRAGTHHLCWCQARDGGTECKEDWDFVAESGEVQVLCPRGEEMGSERGCHKCPAGREQPDAGLEPCSECSVGQFASEGKNCEPCQDGTFAALTGSSTCSSCRAWESANDDAVDCSTDPQKMVLLAAFFIFVGTFCALLMQVVRMRVPVLDVSLEQGHTIVTTFRSHGLTNFGSRSFLVALHDTGHPELNSPPQPFRARVKDAVRLELLTSEGSSINKRLDTSRGTLTLAFPHDLYHQGWPVPSTFSLPLLLTIVVVIACVVVTRDMEVVAFVGAAAVALICTAASAAVRWWPRATPLTRRVMEFRQRVGHRLHHTPRTFSKGPERAIAIGKLLELLQFFHDFIRDRTAYYLVSNIILPLTSKSKLSYSELVGAGQVEWFVSHFWGTPFTHFCAALQKHAEMACGERDWNTLRYWVCFCSNNQYHLAEEVGANWRESSFYITLRSGLCQGTCMVLDDKALPLTRIWCIFELLQTVKLERNEANFQGLLLCTSSGVLNTGGGSVEVAMALAQKVAEMDLSTARASKATDETMIRAHVVQEMGSFSALNRFVCSEVRDMLLCAQRNSNQRFAAVLAHLNDDIAGERMSL